MGVVLSDVVVICPEPLGLQAPVSHGGLRVDRPLPAVEGSGGRLGSRGEEGGAVHDWGHGGDGAPSPPSPHLVSQSLALFPYQLGAVEVVVDAALAVRAVAERAAL